MKFKEWLLQEMATISKQGIEISTPENIEYLSSIPKKSWAGALRKKYSDFLMDYVNDGTEPEALSPRGKQSYPVNANMEALVKQLQDAGIDIKDMSRETRSGDFLGLAPTEAAADKAARRWVKRWIYLSLGVPKELITKFSTISDPEMAGKIEGRAKNMQASDLAPNVGVMWRPNAMQPALNSYDAPQEADQALLDIASKSGMSVPQLQQKVQQHALTSANNYAAKGEISPEQASEFAKQGYDHFINNLRTFRDKPQYVIAQSVNSQVKRLILKSRTKPSVANIGNRRQAYNQQQVDTGFASPTPDTHRLETDPLTLRNRQANKSMPMPATGPKLDPLAAWRQRTG